MGLLYLFYHRCGLGDPGFDSQKGQKIWFFKKSRASVSPSLSLLFDGYRASVTGVKGAGREDDQSPPSSAKVRNKWSHTFMACAGDNFTPRLMAPDKCEHH